MEMLSISAMDDYEIYRNVVFGREFLLAITSVLEDKLIKEVITCSFFFIMVDEFIDKASELHMALTWKIIV